MFNLAINPFGTGKGEYYNSTRKGSSDDELITSDFIKTSWYSLLYNVPGINGRDNTLLEEKVFEIIDIEENWEKRLSLLSKDNLGLDGGMAGLGLAILNGLLKSKRKK